MSTWMAIWAVVSACTALVQSFGGLVACRFFLGITEVSLFRSKKREYTLTSIKAPVRSLIARAEESID
jgi:hypothetical protein